MKLSMRLTMDELVRALRVRAEIIVDERVEEGRRQHRNRKTSGGSR